MLKTYEKGQGDTSVRIETEYKLNEAGAKQYILDQIKVLDSFNPQNCILFDFKYHSVSGALLAFFSLGLIDVFDYEELSAKTLAAFKRYMDRVMSPVEQI